MQRVRREPFSWNKSGYPDLKLQHPTTSFFLSTMKRTLLAITVALLCTALPSPLHAEFKPEIKYAQVGDVKLAYYTRGEGEPLLMINGFMSSMSFGIR
jgi:hypothetical protein